MEKETMNALEKRLKERATSKFDALLIETMGVVERDPILSRLIIQTRKDRHTLSGLVGKTIQSIKYTNLFDIKKSLIEEYAQQEADTIISIISKLTSKNIAEKG